MKALLLCLALSFLLSVGCIGCANGRPPIETLDQWEAEYNRIRTGS